MTKGMPRLFSHGNLEDLDIIGKNASCFRANFIQRLGLPQWINVTTLLRIIDSFCDLLLRIIDSFCDLIIPYYSKTVPIRKRTIGR